MWEERFWAAMGRDISKGQFLIEYVGEVLFFRHSFLIKCEILCEEKIEG